jgi:hypothetical protein
MLPLKFEYLVVGHHVHRRTPVRHLYSPLSPHLVSRTDYVTVLRHVVRPSDPLPDAHNHRFCDLGTLGTTAVSCSIPNLKKHSGRKILTHKFTHRERLLQSFSATWQPPRECKSLIRRVCLDCHGRGREFESRLPRHSNPILPTIFAPRKKRIRRITGRMMPGFEPKCAHRLGSHGHRYLVGFHVPLALQVPASQLDRILSQTAEVV